VAVAASQLQSQVALVPQTWHSLRAHSKSRPCY